MEKLAGRPLDWYGANPEQKAKVLSQLVGIYEELEKHPLPKMGSLSLSASGEVEVGPFAQLPCFETPEQALGPFASFRESCTSVIKQQTTMLAENEVNALRVENYLSFLWRLEQLDALVTSISDDGPFYLKHYDDKGDHILVDGDFNITGVIDWEWASAEAKPYAFSSPCMLWPVGDYYDGKNNLAAEETQLAELFSRRRGRDDLAALVHHGRPWQRYLFFLGGGIPRNMDEFEPLFLGLREAFADSDKESGAKSLPSYTEWKSNAIAGFAKDDEVFAALAKEQNNV